MIKETRMVRAWCILLGFGSVIVSSALPDIVNVTVKGSVSGDGDIEVACGLATPGCTEVAPGIFRFGVSYSFADTNTTLGDFSDGGSASLGAPFSGSVEGDAFQNATATAQSLDITLDGAQSAYGIYADAFTEENDSISVFFELTKESEIQLSGSTSLYGSAFTGQLLDSHGNVILVIPSGGGSASQLLEPGMFQLDASANSSANFYGGQFENAVDFEADLQADFAPAPTPEPRGVILAALLSLVMGGSVVYRRRRVS
jgi:hypothetical protein